ncbi:MAG: GPO family capsid scaffolding protein [Rhodocyclaceae bacterium]|nr:GPO family capsid scaffolding protein [Rhodocyclaceae bacterium]
MMTEGDTSDGRKIERNWIEQMARNYDAARYGARIWLEHMRGMHPDSSFRAYGDVVALKAEQVEDGRLALFAQLDPTPDLIEINKRRQKIYTSAEVDNNFARSGEAYLVGLAVTDSPASLGTEMLQFAAVAGANPLAARKQSADNLFTAAQPITLEFEDDAMNPKDNNADDKNKPADKTLLSKISDLLAGKKDDPAPEAITLGEDAEAAFTALATAHAEQAAQVKTFAAAREADAATIKSLGDKVETLSAALTEVSKAFDAFKSQMDATPEGNGRSPANGGGTADPDLGL